MTLENLAISKACMNAYSVDILLKDGAPWFKACEVARILGYQNTRDAVIKHVKEKYKLTREALGPSDSAGSGSGELQPTQDSAVYISEPGLYSLILRSKKPEAEAFQDWVVQTVLPTIRAQGSYQTRRPFTKLQICLINEFDLQVKVVDFIRRFFKDKDPNIVISQGELQDTDQKRINSYRAGYVRGQCDILLLNKSKKYVGMALELKTPAGNGVVSPDQEKFLKRMEQQGFRALVSNDYDEIVMELQQYFKDVRYWCNKCNKHSITQHNHKSEPDSPRSASASD